MPKDKVGGSKSEHLLVLAVDIDNDLYRKTKISGPVLGSDAITKAATQLALADPEETDANTMFEAVKLFNQLKKDGYEVNVATITGSENEGYGADSEVAVQLEQVVNRYKPDACVFVTDGASDERVLPLISTRIKVNSIKVVTMRQASNLESTYFVILEKLKEPHYARTIFGIPAMLLLLFAISYSIGTSWQLPVVLVGLYLLAKAFGLEDTMINSFRGFSFSIDRMSFVFYSAAIVFFLAGMLIGVGNYFAQRSLGSDIFLSWAYALQGFILLLPVALVLYLVGRMIDLRSSKQMFKGFTYGVYIGSSIVAWVLIYSLMAWVLGEIYFSEMLLLTVSSFVLAAVISMASTYFRTRALQSKKLYGKLVVNELGTSIGKVSRIELSKGVIRIDTSFGNAVNYTVDRITDISDKIVIK